MTPRCSDITMSDYYCGAGGSSTAGIQVAGVRVTMAVKHWDLAIEMSRVERRIEPWRSSVGCAARSSRLTTTRSAVTQRTGTGTNARGASSRGPLAGTAAHTTDGGGRRTERVCAPTTANVLSAHLSTSASIEPRIEGTCSRTSNGIALLTERRRSRVGTLAATCLSTTMPARTFESSYATPAHIAAVAAGRSTISFRSRTAAPTIGGILRRRVSAATVASALDLCWSTCSSHRTGVIA